MVLEVDPTIYCDLQFRQNVMEACPKHFRLITSRQYKKKLYLT